MQALKVQEIQLGKEKAVVVPLGTWLRLLEYLEELEDAQLYDEAMADPDQDLADHAELCRRIGRCPLRYLRGRAGLTQEQLAEKTGLSQSFIAKVERNQKRLSEASRRKVARMLSIDASELG